MGQLVLSSPPFALLFINNSYSNFLDKKKLEKEKRHPGKPHLKSLKLCKVGA